MESFLLKMIVAFLLIFVVIKNRNSNTGLKGLIATILITFIFCIIPLFIFIAFQIIFYLCI